MYTVVHVRTLYLCKFHFFLVDSSLTEAERILNRIIEVVKCTKSALYFLIAPLFACAQIALSNRCDLGLPVCESL